MNLRQYHTQNKTKMTLDVIIFFYIVASFYMNILSIFYFLSELFLFFAVILFPSGNSVLSSCPCILLQICCVSKKKKTIAFYT